MGKRYCPFDLTLLTEGSSSNNPASPKGVQQKLQARVSLGLGHGSGNRSEKKIKIFQPLNSKPNASLTLHRLNKMSALFLAEIRSVQHGMADYLMLNKIYLYIFNA